VALLPAVALGTNHRLRDGWNATRGRGFHLWGGAWFAVLPFVILVRIIEAASFVFVESELIAALIAGFAVIAVSFGQAAIWAGFASSIFRQTGALGAGLAAPSA
jgi:hypothetical protein